MKRIKGRAELYAESPFWSRFILAHLRERPMTVPELAEALGIPPYEVMMHLHAMRRYGLVEEAPKARREKYYRYRPRS
ncbi:MAG: winged helix-turn-helix transcriptional regulator [Thermodesulfobacteria bacterium]|nr:winged helix-turn-helix transcriptional regulator [Thermodesulfobacteriota bacterium]